MQDTCNISIFSIPYRSGFLEIGNVHKGLINIESWQVRPEVNISNSSSAACDKLSDEDFTGNTELELSPIEAKALAKALLVFAERAENTLDQK